MRSTTPIDIDVDGNGIVESDENLAPDKSKGRMKKKATTRMSVIIKNIATIEEDDST